MFKHCYRCSADVPMSAWQAHRKVCRSARPTRNGRGASARQKARVKASQGQLCFGCRQPSSQLEVHHVDGNWRNNSAQNLVALCPDCHRQADAEVRQAKEKAKAAEDQARRQVLQKQKDLT